MSFRRMLIVVVCMLSAAMAWYAFNKPQYDWDMLAYAGVYYQNIGYDSIAIHDKVYKDLFSELLTNVQILLTSNKYEKLCKDSGNYFISQLPFYSVKPLYNDLVYLFCSIGVTPFQAMRIISAIAYFCFIVLTFLLLRHFVVDYTAIAFSLLISATPIVYMTARMLTPDMLSAAFGLCAVVLYVVHRKYHAAMILLLISIGVRPDNIILASMAAISFGFSDTRKNKWLHVVAYLLTAIAIYFSILVLFHGYGWKITFQHSVINLAKPLDEWSNTALTLSDYFGYTIKSLSRYKLLYLPALLLTSVSLLALSRLRNLKVVDERMIAACFGLIASVIIKLVAFPRFDLRYYVLQYVMAWCVVVMMIAVPVRINQKTN